MTRVLGVSSTGLVSGAERVLVRYARPMEGSPMRWSVMSPDGPLTDELAASRIDHQVLPSLRLGGGRRSLEQLGLVRRTVAAARLIRRASRQVDVIVANSVMALPAIRLARPAVPVCWLVHDVVTRRDITVLARVGAPVVDLAIPVSQTAGNLARKIGLPVVVIHNGVNWPVPPAAVDRGDPPIVGINAMMTPWKGQREFVEAMKLVTQPCNIELLGGTFPNDHGYRELVKELVDQSDLRGRVDFLGHSDDPVGSMRRWSVAVSASIEPEAGPLAVTEAMSIGLPVVVTNHGGAPEIVNHLGICVEPANPVEMASAIDDLLADPARRETLGRAGRQRIGEHFTLSGARTRFDEALANLVGGP